MKNAAIEILIKLSSAAFTAGTAAVGNAAKQMGGVIDGAMRKSRTAFQTGGRGVRAYREEMRRLNATAGELKSTIGQVVAMVGGGFLLGSAGRSAVSFNSTVEQSQIGLAALVRTFNDFPAGVNTYEASMDVAADIQRQLQIEGLKTVATYKQLLVALQEGAGPAFKRGFDPAQVVRFVSLMTQAAAAISLPMDQLGQEIRSILDGTIDRNSRVAKALGITNEKVKEMAASGQLFEYLKGRLEEFAVAGEDMAKTWTGALSNLGDAVQMGLGKGLEGGFTAMKKLFLDMRDVIVEIDGTEFTFNERIMAALASADQAISSFIAGITKEDMERYLETLADTIAAVIEAIVMFAEAMRILVDAMGPALPFLAKWTTSFILFGGALKVLVGLPLLIGKQLLALNAGFAAMTGMNVVGWLGRLRVAAIGALAALGPHGVLLLAIAAAAVYAVYSISKLISNYKEIKQLQKDTAAIQAVITKNEGEIAAKLREVSDATGVVVTSMDELNQAVKDGKIHYDKLTGEWKKGAGEMAKSGQDSARMQSKALKEATDEMKKAYKDYADEVKRLQDEISSDKLDFAEEEARIQIELVGDERGRKIILDQVAEIKRLAAEAGRAGGDGWKQQIALLSRAKGLIMSMSTDAKEVSKEEVAAARQRLELARQEVKQHNVFSKRSAYKQALEDYQQLVAAQKNGPSEAEKQDNIKEKLKSVKEINQQILDIKKEQEEATKKAADALNKESGGKLAEEMPEVAKAFGEVVKQAEDLAAKSAEFNTQWNSAWDDFLKDGGRSVDEMEKRLKELTKDRHIKVYVKEIAQKALGGLIGTARRMANGGAVAFRNMLSGGAFPGFGGGDRRHVIAEDGEYMFDKFRSRDLGLDALRTLHAGRYREFIAMIMERFNIDPAELSRKIGQRMNLGGIVGRMSLPSLPSAQLLAGGGAVVGGSGAGGGDTITIHANFSGAVSPMDRSTARRNVQLMMDEIERIKRRRS
jgi:hypothetical protein